MDFPVFEIKYPAELRNFFFNLCPIILSTLVFLLSLMHFLDKEAVTLSWEIQPLPDKLSSSEAIIVINQNQSFLYIFGGEHSPTEVSSVVRYTPLTTDGSSEEWRANLPLPISLKNHAVVSFKDMVYVIGGKTNPGEISATTNFSNRIYCGQLNETGNISWINYSLLPDGLEWLAFHAAVASTKRIYVIGGLNEHGNSQEVWSIIPGDSCQENLDWESEEQLATGLSNHSATIATLESGEQFVYVIGGVQTSSLINLIQYAKVEPGGKLSGWQTLGELEFVDGIQRHKTIVSEGFLYVIGGSTSFTLVTALNSVYRANIGENGYLSSWEELNNLPNPMHSHSIAASSFGQIYLLGGDESNDSFYDEMLYTPLFWFSKSFMPSSEVFVGDQITYTIHYTNNGIRPLTNVTITDEIPANTFLVDPDYPPDTPVLTWTVSTLDLNESGAKTFTVRVIPPLTAVPPQLSTPVPTPTAPQPDLDLQCSTSWPGGGGTPRPTCTPTSTPIPLPTTPVPPTAPPPDSTRYFDLTPIPVINQAWLCEEEWCIPSNTVINTPYHWYLPIISR